ncbi:SprB repeat-containing protein, partial [Flavobacterium sp. XS1P27]|uniref:SprB repeat-containing protein n=1 Tax=Flavobacterium sp. XS1P27 TaxID=3401724 RepID=UPI003AAF3361
ALADSSKTDAACYLASTGSVTAGAVTNAVGTVTYSWKNASNIEVGNSANVSNLPAGTYTLTVTDNCSSKTNSVTISQPDAALLAAIATPNDVSCFGGNNGSATASATGGTATYTYLWNDAAAQTTATASGLTAGNYMVTVTDANGCTDTESVTINDGDGTPPVISQLPNETTINCPSIPQFATPTATDNVDTDVTLTYDDVETLGQCAGSYSITRTWTATDDCGNKSTKSQKINVQDITAPTFTAPANITISSDENCAANTDPSSSGTVTNINDNCDSNPTVRYVDIDCYGVTNPTEINAGNGNYFPFTISGYDGLTANNIENIALSFETNQGKGRAEFTLVAPNGQAVILVGPYCEGGDCDDANSNTKELYLPVFYPNSSGYTQWENNNYIQDGISQNFTPNGATTSTNTVVGLTSYVSSLDNLTGPMNGNWFIFSRKQASVNGSIKFNSVCLKPASSCPGNKVISRTWTVTDACGNKNSATQTIKIEDTTAPTWSTEATALNTTIECSNAEALAAAQATYPTAIDACDNDVTNIEKTSGAFAPTLGCANAGTYTNTWTVTDACGNTSSVFTQVITIEDTTA